MCEFCVQPFNKLQSRRVVIAVNASISIYRIPDLARDLVREGAEVICALSNSAQKLVSPEIFRWATGNQPVTEISGNIEHISLFRDKKNTVLLIAPATYNVIGKIAAGISDSIPSLFFSYAFGHGCSVIIAPAMHEDMLRNPIAVDNIRKLQSLGVKFVQPRIEDEKAKIQENNLMIDEIYRSFYGKLLEGKRFLIISGRSEESIDPVRVLTNRSTGLTGYWFARNLYRMGAASTTLIGNSEYDLPAYVNHIRGESSDSYYTETRNELRTESYDAIIVPAAISDFQVKESKTKLPGNRDYSIDLKPRGKLVDEIRKNFTGKKISYKLSEEFKGLNKMNENEYIVYNKIKPNGGNFGHTSVNYTVYHGNEKQEISGLNKEDITWKLIIHVMEIGSADVLR